MALTPATVEAARAKAQRTMRCASVIALIAWLVSVGDRVTQAAPQNTGPVAAASQAAVIKQYCITCHNDRLRTGNLALDSIDLANLSANADTWEKVVRKLRTRSMPPIGARRPDDATYHSLVDWVETELDRAEASQPNPGRPLIHRLNRTEYANAIRDLLALDIGDVTALLPAGTK